MKLIEHVGYKPNGKNTLIRKAIFECPTCFNRAELSIEYVEQKKKSDLCKNCVRTTHGLSNHPLYNVWKGILNRCYNTKNKHYKNYGGNGVTVCKEWKDSVTAFVEWGINNGYKPGLRIDKDVKSGKCKVYSPDTCQFTTNTVNNRATRILRKTNTSGYRGVYYNKIIKSWVAAIKVDYKTINLGNYYESALEAAKVYDSYINKHKLEHTKNGVLKKGEVVLPKNKHIGSNNKSGYIGISWNSRSKKWRISLTENKKTLLDKSFNCKHKAAIYRNTFIVDNNLNHKLNNLQRLKQEI